MDIKSLFKVLGLCFLLFGCAETEMDLNLTDVTQQRENVDISTILINPISLENTIRLRLLNSFDVLSSEIVALQGSNNVGIAQSAFYPEIFYNLGPSTDDNFFSIGNAGVEFTLFDFGLRNAELAAAKAELQVSKYETVISIENNIGSVLEQYFRLAMAENTAKKANSYFSEIEKLGEIVKNRVELGVESPVSLNEFNIGQNNASSEIARAKANLLNAKLALSSTTGLPFSKNISTISTQGLVSKFSLKTLKKIIPENFDAYPSQAASNEAVSAARANLKAANAGRYPQINIRAGVGIQIGDGSLLSPSGVTVGPNLSNAFSLGRGRKNRVNNAALQLYIATENQRENQRLLRLEIEQSVVQAKANWVQYQQMKDILRNTLESKKIMLGEYELGARTARDLIDIEEQVFESEVQINNSLQEYLVSMVRNYIATNQLSDRFYPPIPEPQLQTVKNQIFQK